MPKSIRVLTEVGKDKSVQVDLNQEFDNLQILSLQFSQSELYLRQCSDYGVLVGRVSVNNGFGIPNAKLGIFIPLDNTDANDPIISELYPYRTLNNTNNEGYQYNLLPQTVSYSNHVPTGSFPTKNQIMEDYGWKKVYEKYYKFTVTTNQSGDFMIFGLPLGEHKLVMNLDLSDIGEFSLTPQDAIRMGIATEAQVDGVRFKSSPNFRSLPQIVTIVKDVTILPLWGEEDLCQSSINRTDFDLSSDADTPITLQPTAVFMGSMISTLDRYSINKYKNSFCRVKLKMGELCKMTAGPGEILAIRHTIEQDSNGFPILEQYLMENNGKVIDPDGTWLIELPMNLNYVVTDQFGNQVPSLDASAGVPTTGRYRFKIKWQQPDNLNQDVKRGYFLVPNIKEWGWTSSSTDPNTGPSQEFINSYSFSLDWADYGNSTPAGQQMIQEAILCEDRFYEFYYNKVYTVSQLIDQYRGGKLNRRYNSIKNILDEECESEVLKFPTNDAQFRPDFIYLLASIFLRVITPILIILLVVLHIIGFLLWLLAPVLAFIICVIGYIVYVICQIIRSVRRLLGGDPGKCENPNTTCNRTKKDLDNMIKELRYFPLPNLTYPDCEMCNCTVEQAGPANPSVANVVEPILATRNFSQLSDWGTSTFYDITTDVGGDFLTYYTKIEINGRTGDQIIVDNDYESLQTLGSFPRAIASVLAGNVPIDTTGQTLTLDAFCPIYKARDISIPNCDDSATYKYRRTYFSSNLPMNGRLNLFNTKAKYYNNQIGSLPNLTGTGFSGPEQGPNQIKVSFNYTANTNTFHYDNVLLLSCEDGSESEFTAGRIITFQDLNNSSDLNALSGSTNNDEGIPCITGTTRTTPSANGTISRIITYANPNAFNGPGQPASSTANYTLVSSSADTEYHRWPIDVEYYQVITAMTISQYESLANPSTPSKTTYPWTNTFPANPGTPYYNFRLNNLQERVINGVNLIRIYANNSITRPDFYKWPNCTFCNSDPIWGSEPFSADRAIQQRSHEGWRAFALSNFSLNTLGFNPLPTQNQTSNTGLDDNSFYSVGGDPKTYVFWESQQPVTASSLGKSQVLVFLVKGVDPYSTRNENSYDLSILFGKTYGTGPIITGKYKLNIPIQPTAGLVLPRHNNITQNNGVDSTTGFGIYYQNFNYIPGNDFSGFSSTNHRFYSSLDSSKISTQFGWYQNLIIAAAGNDNATSGHINSSFPGGAYLCVSEPRNTTHGEFGVSLGFENGDTVTTFTTPNGQIIQAGTKGGVGTNITLNTLYGRQVFLPLKNTLVGNLFTTTFNWHAGSAVPYSYINDDRRYLISINSYVSNNQPYYNGAGIYYGDFSFVGRFAWNSLGFAGLVTWQYGIWRIISSEDADGYWLPRLNVKMSTSSPYQTPSYKTYDDPNGYYPREYVEGCELYAFTLGGSRYGTKYSVASVPIVYPSNNQISTNLNTASFFYDYSSYSLAQGDTYASSKMRLAISWSPFYHNDQYYFKPQMRLFSCSYQLPSSQSQDPSNVISTPLSFTNSSKDISVMRSDRLPTSDRTFQMRDVFQNSPDVVDYSFVLHNNPNFAIYTYDDDSIGLSAPPIVTGQNFPADEDVTANTVSQMSSVIDTLNECNKMLPFNCYYNEPVNATGVFYETINADPNKSWKEGSCTSQNILGLGNRMIFDTTTGCYQLASRFILSLKIDIILLLEWKSRLDITFGACRNVFSHVFTNNWINGVLYAYSFKNDKIISRTNQITGYQYCTDTLYLHPPTNTFYYRSSPWKYTGGVGQFIGKDGNSSSDGGNRKYLGNPTTIMDLGPKTSFLQGLVLNDNFDGYIMTDLRDTTFGDTSDILNFFILSRLINTNFLEQLTGSRGAGILGFFTRVKRSFVAQPTKQKNFIDGDAAQLFSINSELGVDSFDIGNYPNADDTFYYGGSNADETVIGIFFKSDQQVRDFLTPKRTIFNPSTTQPSWPTSFGYIPLVKTQYVPFYNWKLKLTSKNWIFGSQQNDWSTNDITAYYYQSLDRLNVTQLSNYMSPVPNLPQPRFSEDFRGYIFNYNPVANLNDPDIGDTNPYYSGGSYSNNNTQIPKEVITHGAPFHFYFGLKKGKTALDRFLTKYTQDTDLI